MRLRAESCVFLVADDGDVVAVLDDLTVDVQQDGFHEGKGVFSYNLKPLKERFFELPTAVKDEVRVNEGDALNEDFMEWLAFHEQTTGLRQPRKRTQNFKKLRGMYRARRSEGFTDDDLRMAVVGAFNDAYRREHGYFGCESVLRPTKVHDLAEKGRRPQTAPNVRTMASREASMRSLEAGQEDRRLEGLIRGYCRVLVLPPEPGEIDPFTEQPVMQPEEARAKLAALVPDVDAAVEQRRAEILRTTFGIRRSA